MRWLDKPQRRLIAMMGGLCFFAALLEYLIPKPLPFIRLGLAQLPLLLAVDLLGFPAFLVLTAVKIIGQALISGSLLSYLFLFSLGGTAASALLMYGLRRLFGKKLISFLGLSVAGALASNVVSLTLARFLVFGDSVRYAVVPVLALGILTGTLLGLCAEYFSRHSLWYKSQGDNIEGMESPAKPLPLEVEPSRNPEAQKAPFFLPSDLAIAGLCMAAALLSPSVLLVRAIQFFFFALLCWISGRRFKPHVTALVILTVTFFNLLIPYGEILYTAGPLVISSGALAGGLYRGLTLGGLFMVSRFSIRRGLVLPGLLGEILSEALGVFAALSEEPLKLRTKADRAGFLGQLDHLLVGIQKKEPQGAVPKGAGPGVFKSRLVLLGLVTLAWMPVLLV
ncbi:MAG: Gx transporter family protein [Treponema sp.]|nr:Gx transporter family protein [Treponema sp.]